MALNAMEMYGIKILSQSTTLLSHLIIMVSMMLSLNCLAVTSVY